MKKLLLLAFAVLAIAGEAQTVTPVAGNTNVQVNPNGTFYISGVLKGTISNNQIKDPSNVLIGTYQNDGTVLNANNQIVGYFKENYDVTNASNLIIGHLRTNLDIKTAANVVIGQYIDSTPPIYNAIAHFFIQP